MHYVTNMFRKTTYKAVNTSVCLLRRRRKRKKTGASAMTSEMPTTNQRSSQR